MQRGLTMKKIIFLIIATTISLSVSAEPLSKKEKDEIYFPYINSCYKNQKDYLENQNYSISQIVEYCDCSGKMIVNTLTVEDVEHMNKTGSYNIMIKIAQSANQYCAQKILD